MEEKLTKQEFADFVRFMRQSIGLSQLDFADDVGVSIHAVKRWESAKALPKLIHLVIKDIRDAVKLRIKEKRERGWSPHNKYMSVIDWYNPNWTEI